MQFPYALIIPTRQYLQKFYFTKYSICPLGSQTLALQKCPPSILKVYEYVRLHGKEKLRVKTELSLLIIWLYSREIILDYLCGPNWNIKLFKNERVSKKGESERKKKKSEHSFSLTWGQKDLLPLMTLKTVKEDHISETGADFKISFLCTEILCQKPFRD